MTLGKMILHIHCSGLLGDRPCQVDMKVSKGLILGNFDFEMM